MSLRAAEIIASYVAPLLSTTSLRDTNQRCKRYLKKISKWPIGAANITTNINNNFNINAILTFSHYLIFAITVQLTVKLSKNMIIYKIKYEKNSIIICSWFSFLLIQLNWQIELKRRPKVLSVSSSEGRKLETVGCNVNGLNWLKRQAFLCGCYLASGITRLLCES